MYGIDDEAKNHTFFFIEDDFSVCLHVPSFLSIIVVKSLCSKACDTITTSKRYMVSQKTSHFVICSLSNLSRFSFFSLLKMI